MKTARLLKPGARRFAPGVLWCQAAGAVVWWVLAMQAGAAAAQVPAPAAPAPLVASAGVAAVDDRGRTVRLARVPQRIVSLLPSLTETVCALQHCARLVAVDRYSNHPVQVQSLPRVGGGLDPQIESIVALRPDLVLVAGSTRAAERLESLGLVVAVFEPQTHADVRRTLLQVGALLGERERAQSLWSGIEAGLQVASDLVPAHAKGARVYIEVNQGPYGAGESSFIGETLRRLGARNILGPELGPFPKVNPEHVVRSDPDLIMGAAADLNALRQRPGWAAMRAVREGRLCGFTPEQSDTIVRPGPRLAEGARLMARCLQALPATAPSAQPPSQPSSVPAAREAVGSSQGAKP